MKNNNRTGLSEAISVAIEKGGYQELAGWNTVSPSSFRVYCSTNLERTAQDPLFWQALGKALDWTIDYCKFHSFVGTESDATGCNDCNRQWRIHAHNYLDIKLTGGDEEKFWKELLK